RPVITATNRLRGGNSTDALFWDGDTVEPGFRSQPKSAGTKAQSWSSEGVRLPSFKAILRSSTPSRSDLSILINAALIDEC
ncbi:MAG: hypothetical protein WCH75_15390, partial [Candidatus Binatia bacterium]